VENINWLSLVIATLIPMIMGFIWYHKAVFGKAWMAETGMTEEKAAQGNMAVIFGTSLVMAFLISFFLLLNCNGPGQEGQYDTFKHGMGHGLIVGLFVVMPTFVTNGLFEQKSWKLIFINVFYWVACFILMGGVVDSMNHWTGAIGGM
jgi:hypothetical protein